MPAGNVLFLNRLKLTVSGDIGCYTLGIASAGYGHLYLYGSKLLPWHGRQGAGNLAARPLHFGDSTFIHSGITGLIDVVLQ